MRLRLAPFGAVSTRHDGGAGQTGVGLEVAGSVRVSGARVRIEAQARMLALHTATDYEERGFSVAATVGGGEYEPGLTASLRPHRGRAGTRGRSLWQDHLDSHARSASGDRRGVDARVGYGLRLSGGRLLTPFGAYGETGAGRRMQVGVNLGMPGLSEISRPRCRSSSSESATAGPAGRSTASACTGSTGREADSPSR